MSGNLVIHPSLILIALALLLTLIASCEEDSDVRETMTAVVNVATPESVRLNESFDLALTVFGSSGCAEFSRFTTSVIGDTTVFRFYEKRDDSITCSTNVIQIPVEISLTFETAGKKYLKFNAEPSIYSDETTLILDSLIVIQ